MANDDTVKTMEERGMIRVDVERALVGALLLNPSAYHDVADWFRPAAFFLERHALIYAAIARLHDRRSAVDLLTIGDELGSKMLAELGGHAALLELENEVPSAVHVESYARLVDESYVRRRLVRAASAIAEMAYNVSEDDAGSPDLLINSAEAIIYGVADERTAEGELVSVKGPIGDYLDHVADLMASGVDRIGPATGFRFLDAMLGGLGRDDLSIVAGRPGMGKTALLMQIALNAAKAERRPVAVFSLEMSAASLVNRWLAGEARIDSALMRRGRVDENGFGRIADAAGRLGDVHLYIDTTRALTPSSLHSRCRRLAGRRGPLALIVVDYLQLMGSERFYSNKVHEISYISGQLVKIAADLKTPILAASQLSRAVEGRSDKRPLMSDLRESGAIEQDAARIMLMYREDYYRSDTRPNITDVELAKNRFGPTGSVELWFEREFLTFREITKEV